MKPVKRFLLLSLLACAALGIAWWLGHSSERGRERGGAPERIEARERPSSAEGSAIPTLAPPPESAAEETVERSARTPSADGAATAFVLRGTVRDEREQLVDDCEVVAEPRRPARDVRPPFEEDENDGDLEIGQTYSVPAPGGTFAFEPLAPGAWYVHAEHEGRSSERVLADLDQDGATVTLHLVSLVRVAGVVLDPDGHPFSNGRVVANSLAASVGYRLGEERVLNCDERGRFELALAGGAIVVQARADDWAPSEEQHLDLVPGAERTDLVLRLVRGARLTGVLLDAVGAPLSRKSVELSGAAHVKSTSGERGRFAFAALPPGDYVLAYTARKNDVQRAPLADETNACRLALTLADGETREVVLTRAPGTGAPEAVVVRGTVHHRGAPCPGAMVRVLNTAEPSPTAIADDDGRFMLSVDSAGRLLFTVALKPGPAATFVRDVRAEGAVELDFELSGAEIAGRLFGPDGQAVAHAPITLVPEVSGSETELSLPSYALSDEQGRFVLRGVPAGSYRLAAGRKSAQSWRAPIEQRVTLAPDERLELVLRLPAAGRLRGTVRTADGAIFPGAEIFALGPMGPETTYCGPLGEYALAGLVPGRQRVFARTAETCSDWSEVELGGGSEVTLDLTLVPAARVEVEVVDENGEPLAAEIAIQLVAPAGLNRGESVKETSENSRLRASLPLGDYELIVSIDGSVDVSADVSASGTPRFERRPLHLTRPGPERVRVVLARPTRGGGK
jgi:hypothetical protein